MISRASIHTQYLQLSSKIENINQSLSVTSIYICLIPKFFRIHLIFLQFIWIFIFHIQTVMNSLIRICECTFWTGLICDLELHCTRGEAYPFTNIYIQYKKPWAEKKLAPIVDSFNSNKIRKWCPNYLSQMLAASIVIRSESGAPITTLILLEGGRCP